MNSLFNTTLIPKVTGTQLLKYKKYMSEICNVKYKQLKPKVRFMK